MVKCHLKFTDFPVFCQELVSNLHGTTHLSDISLVGDDNKPIRAHKIVISAHSGVIREALAATEHEKPLLHCRGFSSQDIQLLLDFMYLGQTSCEAKNVNLFFKTGKFLQIKEFIKISENFWKIKKQEYFIGRVEIDPKRPQTCPVENILFYQSKKTPEQLSPDMPFILLPKRSGTYQDFWFQNQRMGKHIFMELFRNALEKAGVDLSGQKTTLSSAYRARIRNNEQILKETQSKLLESLKAQMCKSSSQFLNQSV